MESLYLLRPTANSLSFDMSHEYRCLGAISHSGRRDIRWLKRISILGRTVEKKHHIDEKLDH